MIQEEHLAQGIIILSCYDSFEYAQKAISLGIDSYLLKCDISQENLDRELDGVIEKISRKQRSTLNLTTEKELEDDKKIICDSYENCEARKNGSKCKDCVHYEILKDRDDNYKKLLMKTYEKLLK